MYRYLYEFQGQIKNRPPDNQGAGIINRVEGGVGKLLLKVKIPLFIFSLALKRSLFGSKIAIGIKVSCKNRYISLKNEIQLIAIKRVNFAVK
jgi:hypothetical protein